MIAGIIQASPDPDFFLLLVISIGIILLFVLFIISILLIYQKRTYEQQQKLHNIEQSFRQEMLKAQLEITEQTLTNVSQELHDNIGQVLSFVKLSLGMAPALPGEKKDDKIIESRDLIAQAITDLRDLSKSLSQDNIISKGFAETVKAEVDRINRSRLLNVELVTSGTAVGLGAQRELVLYRVVQETVNNSLKHGHATNMKISLDYCTDLFTLTLCDDGVGFDLDQAMAKNGSGLKNIQNRANLIGADIAIDSRIGAGTTTRLSLNPNDEELYANGHYTGSFSR